MLMTKFGPFGRYFELSELTYNFLYPYFVQFALYVVRQESNETGAVFFYLTFTYKSTLCPSK